MRLVGGVARLPFTRSLLRSESPTQPLSLHVNPPAKVAPPRTPLSAKGPELIMNVSTSLGTASNSGVRPLSAGHLGGFGSA